NVSANVALTGANAIGNSVTVNRNFTVSGSQNLEFSGSVTLALTPTISDTSSGVTTFSGNISGAGFGLTKANSGTIVLSGASTYTGPTTVSAGTVSINSIANVNGGSSAVGAPTTSGNGTIAIGSTST